MNYTPMTRERMDVFMGKLMNQLDRGLIGRLDFNQEMALLLRQRRRTLVQRNSDALNSIILRWQESFITMDEMLLGMQAQQISYEREWH